MCNVDLNSEELIPLDKNFSIFLTNDYNKTFRLQVKPSSSLDLCVSSPEQVANKLKSFVVGEGNKLDEFLNKGELSQAVQLGISVIKSANEKSECEKELDPKDKALVREKKNCLSVISKT